MRITRPAEVEAVFKLWNLVNTSLLIHSTLFDISIDSNQQQPQKVQSSMYIMKSGSTTDVNPVQK